MAYLIKLEKHVTGTFIQYDFFGLACSLLGHISRPDKDDLEGCHEASVRESAHFDSCTDAMITKYGAG